MNIVEARRIAKHLESGGRVEDQMQIRRAFHALDCAKTTNNEERQENIRLAQKVMEYVA